jgi:hypothetical protein
MLEREGVLERDTEQLDLAEALITDDSMPSLARRSIIYSIEVALHCGHKAFRLQTLRDDGRE